METIRCAPAPATQLQKSLPSDVKLGIIVNTSDNILNTIDSLEETIILAPLAKAVIFPRSQVKITSLLSYSPAGADLMTIPVRTTCSLISSFL